MSVYWKDDGGNDESFWEHEWGKHGTCVSTFDPSCYVDYIPTQEVVDYFQKTLQLFSVLDTYTFLKDAGIVPSYTKTYTYAEIRKALVQGRGVNATIGSYFPSPLNPLFKQMGSSETFVSGLPCYH